MDNSVVALHPATEAQGRSARLISVDVDQIEPYERNARITPNIKREELKRITLRDGAPPGQLVVTRRPGSPRFVLARGGNTRLAIIRQLRDEFPDDPRWQAIWVVQEPYVSELHLAVNAMQENDARGELIFIEKALAFCRVYELWAAEQPEREATIQTFLQFFSECFGRPPARAEAYRMKFAVETLYPLLPTALVVGRWSSNAVRRLVEYRNKLCELWVTAGFGDLAEFEEYFYTHLGRQERDMAATARLLADEPLDDATSPHSDLQIDYDRLSAALANEMARVDHVDVDEARIRDWIDAVLRGTPVEYIAAAEPIDGSSPDPDDIAALGLGRPKAFDFEAYDTEDVSDAIRAEHARKREQAQVMGPPMEAAVERPGPFSLATSREAAFPIARRIADRHRFGTLILPYQHGVGYLVADTILHGNDEHVPLARAAPWWVLVSCGLILDLPPAIAEAVLPEQSVLRASIASRQTELISLVMGPPASFGRYLAALNDLDMQDFLLLIRLTQNIIRTAASDDFLWGDGIARATPARPTPRN